MKNILVILLPFLFLGCNNEYKQKMLEKELKQKAYEHPREFQKREAIKVVEIDAQNFSIVKNEIPDKENIKRIKILGAELDDVIALLTEATNQNIIFQTQANSSSNNNQESTNTQIVDSINTQENTNQEIKESQVYISASNIGFGRVLKKTVGDKLSIRYDDDTYYLGYLKTVTLKIPSLAGLNGELEKTLETLGAINIVHDAISSSVTFSAREKEYGEIMKYLEILRNNLYVVEYDIAIYNVELKDNYNLGIDWSLITNQNKETSFNTQTSSSFGSTTLTGTTSSVGAIFNAANLTGSMIAQTLTQFGKVESIQRPRLLGIAGTDVTLVDGLEEPYIKEIKTTSVGDSGVQTSTVSASALSGIKVTLNSNILDGTVLTDISLDINDVVSYNSFEVDGTTYSQPKMQTKTIKSSMRVQPGVPIVISGLFKNKLDKGYKGIPGVASTSARLFGGSEYDGATKSEMVIIVTPRVIRYVMK